MQEDENVPLVVRDDFEGRSNSSGRSNLGVEMEFG